MKRWGFVLALTLIIISTVASAMLSHHLSGSAMGLLVNTGTPLLVNTGIPLRAQ